MHELLPSYSSCNSDSFVFLVAPLSKAILRDDLGLSIDRARWSGFPSSSLG